MDFLRVLMARTDVGTEQSLKRLMVAVLRTNGQDRVLDDTERTVGSHTKVPPILSYAS